MNHLLNSHASDAGIPCCVSIAKVIPFSRGIGCSSEQPRQISGDERRALELHLVAVAGAFFGLDNITYTEQAYAITLKSKIQTMVLSHGTLGQVE